MRKEQRFSAEDVTKLLRASTVQPEIQQRVEVAIASNGLATARSSAADVDAAIRNLDEVVRKLNDRGVNMASKTYRIPGDLEVTT